MTRKSWTFFLLCFYLSIGCIYSCSRDEQPAEAIITPLNSRHIAIGDSITFDGSQSKAHDYKWFVNNEHYSECREQAFCTIAFNEQGTYLISLHVKREIRADITLHRTSKDRDSLDLFVGLPGGAGEQGKYESKNTGACLSNASVQLVAHPETFANAGALLFFQADASEKTSILWKMGVNQENLEVVDSCNALTECSLAFEEEGTFYVQVEVQRQAYFVGAPFPFNCGKTTATSTATIVIYPS